MANVQKLDFFAIFPYALPINCVTTGARELNGIYQIWLDPIIQSVLDRISSGLARIYVPVTSLADMWMKLVATPIVSFLARTARVYASLDWPAKFASLICINIMSSLGTVMFAWCNVVLVFLSILDMVSEIKRMDEPCRSTKCSPTQYAPSWSILWLYRAHYWVVHPGANPGFLEKAFICFKMMGFALLILSLTMKWNNLVSFYL